MDEAIRRLCEQVIAQHKVVTSGLDKYIARLKGVRSTLPSPTVCLVMVCVIGFVILTSIVMLGATLTNQWQVANICLIGVVGITSVAVAMFIIWMFVQIIRDLILMRRK